MTFKTPIILIAIPIVLALMVFLRARQKGASFRFPSTKLISSGLWSWKTRGIMIPFFIRLAVVTLFIVALAGPRKALEETVYETQGIDIVLAIDASGSMAAEDFKIKGQRVNRLAVVKDVVDEFIQQRRNDRIGLIAFAGLAYTVCPLTTDYSWLSENLERVELGMIKDGTAVGSAIASSLTRLEKSEAKSKVVILLTDGVNNAGKIDPLTAARAAQAQGVKVYTIGAGTKGRAPFPTRDFFGRTVYRNVIIDLDEDTLRKIARMTGASYFRATDTESLREVYKEIDQMEKTKIEQYGYFQYEELFDYVLAAALILFLLEIILSNTVLLKVP